MAAAGVIGSWLSQYAHGGTHTHWPERVKGLNAETGKKAIQGAAGLPVLMPVAGATRTR